MRERDKIILQVCASELRLLAWREGTKKEQEIHKVKKGERETERKRERFREKDTTLSWGSLKD